MSLRPHKHILVSISSAARQLCNFRVTEIEVDLEEQLNSSQSESRDDIKQKAKIDTITSSLKSLRLQKEFLKLHLRDTNTNALVINPVVTRLTINHFRLIQTGKIIS